MAQNEQTNERPALINPFDCEGNWYKANLHAHTTTSDGDTPFRQRIRQYRENGYAILALTDHDQTNDIANLASKDFLILNGMETHPPCPIAGDNYHLVCLNVPFGFTLPENADANTRIEMVKQAGGEVMYGHPYWCGHRLEHILNVKGFLGIEVFNATCTKIGKGFSNVQWDDLLNHGLNVPAVAVDDVHGGRDMFMGWTMIKAKDLTVNSVMEALRGGCFYASCGPTINDFRILNGSVVLKCSPAAEIHFIGQKYCGLSVYADDDPDLTWAEFPLQEGLRYIRGEVVDRKGRRAWTNPIILKR
ncbi:MAG: CehA/McbA family metallohydrolase [Phycisphaerae bacterium]